MWVNGIDVLEELLAMFFLLDEKGVIYIPEQQPGCIREVLMALDSNTSMNRLPTRGLMEEPWTCSKYLPWMRK